MNIKKFGTKLEVFMGEALMTKRKLKFDDLELNINGNVVIKKNIKSQNLKKQLNSKLNQKYKSIIKKLKDKEKKMLIKLKKLKEQELKLKTKKDKLLTKGGSNFDENIYDKVGNVINKLNNISIYIKNNTEIDKEQILKELEEYNEILNDYIIDTLINVDMFDNVRKNEEIEINKYIKLIKEIKLSLNDTTVFDSVNEEEINKKSLITSINKLHELYSKIENSEIKTDDWDTINNKYNNFRNLFLDNKYDRSKFIIELIEISEFFNKTFKNFLKNEYNLIKETNTKTLKDNGYYQNMYDFYKLIIDICNFILSKDNLVNTPVLYSAYELYNIVDFDNTINKKHILPKIIDKCFMKHKNEVSIEMHKKKLHEKEKKQAQIHAQEMAQLEKKRIALKKIQKYNIDKKYIKTDLLLHLNVKDLISSKLPEFSPPNNNSIDSILQENIPIKFLDTNFNDKTIQYMNLIKLLGNLEKESFLKDGAQSTLELLPAQNSSHIIYTNNPSKETLLKEKLERKSKGLSSDSDSDSDSDPFSSPEYNFNPNWSKAQSSNSNSDPFSSPEYNFNPNWSKAQSSNSNSEFKFNVNLLKFSDNSIAPASKPYNPFNNFPNTSSPSSPAPAPPGGPPGGQTRKTSQSQVDLFPNKFVNKWPSNNQPGIQSVNQSQSQVDLFPNKFVNKWPSNNQPGIQSVNQSQSQVDLFPNKFVNKWPSNNQPGIQSVNQSQSQNNSFLKDNQLNKQKSLSASNVIPFPESIEEVEQYAIKVDKIIDVNSFEEKYYRGQEEYNLRLLELKDKKIYVAYELYDNKYSIKGIFYQSLPEINDTFIDMNKVPNILNEAHKYLNNILEYEPMILSQLPPPIPINSIPFPESQKDVEQYIIKVNELIDVNNFQKKYYEGQEEYNLRLLELKDKKIYVVYELDDNKYSIKGIFYQSLPKINDTFIDMNKVPNILNEAHEYLNNQLGYEPMILSQPSPPIPTSNSNNELNFNVNLSNSPANTQSSSVQGQGIPPFIESEENSLLKIDSASNVIPFPESIEEVEQYAKDVDMLNNFEFEKNNISNEELLILLNRNIYIYYKYDEKNQIIKIEIVYYDTNIKFVNIDLNIIPNIYREAFKYLENLGYRVSLPLSNEDVNRYAIDVDRIIDVNSFTEEEYSNKKILLKLIDKNIYVDCMIDGIKYNLDKIYYKDQYYNVEIDFSIVPNIYRAAVTYLEEGFRLSPLNNTSLRKNILNKLQETPKLIQQSPQKINKHNRKKPLQDKSLPSFKHITPSLKSEYNNIFGRNNKSLQNQKKNKLFVNPISIKQFKQSLSQKKSLNNSLNKPKIELTNGEIQNIMNKMNNKSKYPNQKEFISGIIGNPSSLIQPLPPSSESQKRPTVSRRTPIPYKKFSSSLSNVGPVNTPSNISLQKDKPNNNKEIEKLLTNMLGNSINSINNQMNNPVKNPVNNNVNEMSEKIQNQLISNKGMGILAETHEPSTLSLPQRLTLQQLPSQKSKNLIPLGNRKFTQTGSRTLEGKTQPTIDIDSAKEALKMFKINSLENLTKEKLREIYLGKAKKLHPNRGGNTEKFKELRKAHETLLNIINPPNIKSLNQRTKKLLTNISKHKHEILSPQLQNFSNKPPPNKPNRVNSLNFIELKKK